MPPASAQPLPAGSPAALFRIDGRITPRPVPFAYKITLGLTAFAMVLLPLAYIAVIVAGAWGIYYFAIHGVVIFETIHSIWALIIYLGPLIAGLVMIVFMVKPLFAQPRNRGRGYEIDLAKEPRLRALIADICASVGSPMPVQVYVDCQANASASLRRGLWSLGRKDLVLTIGLPLAEHLTARQLAGVLAHEFGHFRQGAGMAFSYLISSINLWFARVVFERDSWDESLADAARDVDARIGVVLWTAQGAVWVSRRVLHGLMYVGRAITCLQLRQMEFDADYYETHLAGSAAFDETARELRRLGFANQAAFQELDRLWKERKLVDNFPAFIAFRRAQFDSEVLGKIDASADEQKTRWHDTHPSDRARSAHARALGLPGLFQGEGSATALFENFEQLSQSATLHYYRDQLSLEFRDESLVATREAARDNQDSAAAEAARAKLIGPVFHFARPILWSQADFEPSSTPLDPGTVLPSLTSLRDQLTAARPFAEPANQVYETAREELDRANLACAFFAAGVSVPAGAFGAGLATSSEAEARRATLLARLVTQAGIIAPFETAFHDWFSLVVRASRDPAIAARLPTGLAQRLASTAQAHIYLAPWFRLLSEWADLHALLSVLKANDRPGLQSNAAFAALLSSQLEKTRAIVTAAPTLVTAVPWPFPTLGAPRTVSEHLEKALNEVYRDDRLVVLLRTAINLHVRLIGEAAALGTELEKALAPNPGNSPA